MVNGMRTDHSSISVSLNAVEYAIKEIHWDQALDPASVMANDPAAIGWTRGLYQPAFGFELWLNESESFEININNDPNYIGPFGHFATAEIMFPVQIYFRPESLQAVVPVEISMLSRISKSTMKSTGGTAESHFRTYECKAITPITENGRSFYSGAKKF
jgi:hypothetical protein